MRFWYRINRRSESTRKARLYRELRTAVLVAYSSDPPRCACCGEAGLPFLTIDHIKPIRRKRSGSDEVSGVLYARLRREGYPSGFQVLCFNCNCAKRTMDVCPHQASKAGGVK
jgi:5-methylcytosine-specific restriction endonuclease McrA